MRTYVAENKSIVKKPIFSGTIYVEYILKINITFTFIKISNTKAS